MPTNIKCVAFFGSDEGFGWSEKHDIQGDDPPGDLLPFLIAFKTLMVNYRRPLLGMDCYLRGLRVSYATASGVIRSSADRFQPLLYPGNQRPSAGPESSAMMRMGEITNSQFSPTYLRGIWRDVIKNEQLDFTTAAGTQWKQLLDQYVAALVGVGYGWEGQFAPATRKGAVNNYTIDPQGYVTFSIAVLSGPALPIPGSRLSFRFSRINGGKSVLNDTMIVQVLNDVSVKTVVPTAALPFVSEGTFTNTVTSFLTYTGMQYVIYARRPAGRPTLLSRSRRRARARG
jgi:hypothetical protein